MLKTSVYCERLDGSFWAEPFNALSNVALFLAAWAAWRLWRRAGDRDRPVLALIAVVVLIGVGSFLFHTMPAPWSALADTTPIQLFAFGYFVLAMRRFLGLGFFAATAATGAFVAASFAFTAAVAPFLSSTLRGSAGYVPFLVALLATAVLARKRAGEDAARGLALAGALFALSLTLRSIDQAVCATLPIGTHFLWHLLNGAVLFVLLRTAIRHGRACAGGARL